VAGHAGRQVIRRGRTDCAHHAGNPLTAPDADGVSAIVAVRDEERYITQALESILGQSAPPGEVVVVDDGSTDATQAALEPYAGRVCVVQQDPVGAAAALNTGIAASTGVLLAFLDADDVWTQSSLECRLTRLAAPDQPEAVFGRIAQFVSPELGTAAARSFRFDPEPARVTMFQTMLIRRPALHRVGPLATDYVIGANIDWFSRARSAGLRAEHVPETVAWRRIHGRNLGITQRERQSEDLVKAVRAHRRRNFAT
jgi:glycosyltransferase involved in cell wall biosynthesis